jgi:hypothetical protein
MDSDIKQILKSLNIPVNEDYKGEDFFVCKSHFCGNGGFFTVEYKENTVVLLKGIYRDFIRVVKGEKFLKNEEFTKLSETLADIEKNISKDFQAKIEKESKSFIDLNILDEVEQGDITDFLQIDRPLSNVEYNLFRKEDAEDKNLYFNSIFRDSFNEALTPLTCSILNSIPEVMSVIFAHANFKVFSPSMKILWNKLYCNLNNYKMAFETLGSDDTFLKFYYCQFRFLKEKNFKFKIPKVSKLEITNREILSFLSEMDEKVRELDERIFLGEDFFEYISLIFLTSQMIFLNFTEKFLILYNLLGNIDNTLSLIYKTRSKSPFFQGTNTFVFDNFDTASSLKEIAFKKEKEPEKIDDLIARLVPYNIFKRKKVYHLTNELHTLLDFRDSLYLITSNTLSKVHIIVKHIAEKLKNLSKIKYEKMIHYLEYTEIKNILNDNHYGNIQFTTYFRKWQTERFKAQIVPYEIFEKDLPDVENIAKNILSKLLNKSEFDVLSFFHREKMEGEIGKDIIVYKNISDTYHLSSNLQGVITDNVRLLSHLMEFAAIYDIPIYSGIRFPEIVLKGKKVSIDGSKLKIV